jgi:thiol-disulfide isomerase/thioredoxin
MKKSLLLAGSVVGVLLACSHAIAAEAAAPTKQSSGELSPVLTELRQIVSAAQVKIKDGKKTEADLADELKAFDALIAKHKAEKSDDVAQVVFMKAMLYKQVIGDEAKADDAIAALKRDFPDSKFVENLKRQEAAEKVQASLKVGSQFPAFAEKDLEGKPLSLDRFKGKVLLVDFWATWCGPCVQELPNVLEAYKKYHADGFEIVGISLDQSEDKLKKFIADKEMPWPQYFDGKGWQNKLAGQYGINSIPATYLLDGNGKIIGSNLRGKALTEAVGKALGK